MSHAGRQLVTRAWLRVPALILCLATLGACASPAYYAQAVSGHLELMRAREPIDDYLARAEPGDATAARLATVSDMLAFAGEMLDLPADGSYETWAPTNDDAVTWNVVATPPYSLEPKRWCFPVAGCVPYRGYFDQEAAERFAERQRRRDRDVSVSRATAYSTLGWFEDPVLGSMLDGDDADLADTLFHELAHQRLYVAGAAEFNESYATFVAGQGVRAWAGRQDDGAWLESWEWRQQATREFLALLARHRDTLADFYASESDPDRLAAGKAQRFDALRGDYDALVADRWDGLDLFGSWFDPPPNNADLALVSSYTGGLCAFATLWREAEGDFEAFHDLARAAGDLPKAQRRAWLETPCP